jgi:hypothetical protein
MSKPASKVPAPALTATEVIQALKENFVVVSAVAALMGIGLATTFLAAYLGVFDWHLLLFIQYADIITFGLIAIGVLSGFIGIVQSMTQTFLSNHDAKDRRQVFLFALAAVIVVVVFNVGTAIYYHEPYVHILLGGLVLFFALGWLSFVVSTIAKGTWPTSFDVMLVFFFTLSMAIFCGQWLGSTVKETPTFNQDVYVKDQTLNDVKLVIMMSRHTVLFKDGVLYVVPTADITKFRTADRDAKPKFIPEEQEMSDEVMRWTTCNATTRSLSNSTIPPTLTGSEIR